MHTMSSAPPRPRAGASIDYSSQTYWSSRFENEQSFEWLTPSFALIPHITRALDDLGANSLKIIHIGCGNSELSLDLRHLVEGRLGAPNAKVINIDYAAPALDRMRAAELARFGDTHMRWEVLDLLDWTTTSQLLSEPERAVIVDKSCADAIACGPDVRAPLLAGGTRAVHPMEVLALHLAALVAPGSIWLAVSYSSTRFEFLASQEGEKPRASDFWQLERRERITAQTESLGNVHAPEIYHTLFVLKRGTRALDL